MPSLADLWNTTGVSAEELGRRGQFLAVGMQGVGNAMTKLPQAAVLGADALDQVRVKALTLGDALKDSLKSALDRIPDTIRDAFTGGGGLMGALKSILTDLGASIGTILAKSIASRLGGAIRSSVANAGANAAESGAAATGGAIAGGLAGGGGSAAAGIGMSLATAGITMGVSLAIVGGIALFKKLHKSEAQKLGADIGRDLGVNITKELAKSMEANSKQFGRQVATLLDLDKIIEEGGGLNSQNLDRFTHQLHDVFSHLETGAMTAAQATEVLEENFASFAEASTAGNGRISKGMKEIVRLTQEYGLESKAVTDWMKGQGSDAITGFNAVIAGSALATADELANLGTQALAVYTAAVAAGMSQSEALKLIAPALHSMTEAYQRLGLDIDNAAMRSLLFASTITEQNPALIDAIGGLSQEMIALDNLGLLNAETFTSMEVTGLQLYQRLQAAASAAGGTTRDALGPMQDFLHDAAEQAELLNIPLDEGTQMLIDQSRELGIWKERGQSAQEKLISGMGALVDKVGELVDRLQNIPDVDFNINGHYNAPNIPSGNGPGSGDVAHTGGMATLAGISRFHRGTASVLRADEVPAILQTHEAVLNRSATRALGPETIRALNSGSGLASQDGTTSLASVEAAQAVTNRLLDRVLSYFTTQMSKDIADSTVAARQNKRAFA
jgi:hypothetical protein